MIPTSPTSHTRRSLLTAGAWAAPTILLAGAAPAFAVSGVQTLTLSGGNSAVVEEFGMSSLRFRGFSIVVSGGVGPGDLTMTVSNPGRTLTELSTPAGWTLAASSTTKLTYTRSTSAGSGESVAVPHGTYFNDGGTGGAFELSFAAVGHDAARVEFAISSR